jgi:transposase InsO family protein
LSGRVRERILSRRGFVEPEPNKRPHSSFIRFEAALPNECWQADVTHWRLKNGAMAEILDFIDDHSRVIVGARVLRVTRVGDVVSVFNESAAAWGYPASVLTDNGAIFNGGPRRGVTAFEALLTEMGIVYRHSRPYHPQTCGKIERWHQTLKRFLVKQAPARSIAELQHQVDRFVSYYNQGAPAPGPRVDHPVECLRRAGQGPSGFTSGQNAFPGPDRQSRLVRQSHPAPRLEALPHRHWPAPQGHTDPALHR